MNRRRSSNELIRCDAEERLLLNKIQKRPRHILIRWQHVDGKIKGIPVTHSEWRQLEILARKYKVPLADLLHC